MAFHLAQLNIGRVLDPLDHPRMKEFMDGLAPINAVADLRLFVFRTRADWFEKMNHAHYVLWWVPAGHIPALSAVPV